MAKFNDKFRLIQLKILIKLINNAKIPYINEFSKKFDAEAVKDELISSTDVQAFCL